MLIQEYKQDNLFDFKFSFKLVVIITWTLFLCQ
jgi:hypothetical protein